MRNGEELSERKKAILKAVVEAHIDQGEPIGSKFLLQNQQFHLSSATIRNEMAELAELGYLEQPHTSAGRIPSEAGYRFYVNSLMQSYDLTTAELRELNELVKAKATELDKLLDRAGRVMSGLTNYTSLAVRPKRQAVTVMHFKVMAFDPTSFLLVVMVNPETVKTCYIRADAELSEGVLTKLESVLNTFLTGVPMDRVTLPCMLEMENRLGADSALLHTVLKSIYGALGDLGGGDLHLEGVDRLLEYPEYTDIEQLRSMLGAFENKEDILDLVSSGKQDGVNVLIGSENPLDASHNSTFIFKTIQADGHTVGAIGVIGPRRMDYSKVITTVEYLSGQIAAALGSPALPQKGTDPKDPQGGDTIS